MATTPTVSDPLIPPPSINPEFLAAVQKMADANAVEAGVTPWTDEDLFRLFLGKCVQGRVGTSASGMATFADGLVAEYRKRYPIPPPPPVV